MKAILFVLALVTTSTFATPVVDCQTSPGNLICRDLADIKSSMSFTCTGDACYRVWRNQIKAMNRFVQNYNAYITYSPITSAEMGNLAYAAANKICGAKSTGCTERTTNGKPMNISAMVMPVGLYAALMPALASCEPKMPFSA